VIYARGDDGRVVAVICHVCHVHRVKVGASVGRVSIQLVVRRRRPVRHIALRVERKPHDIPWSMSTKWWAGGVSGWASGWVGYSCGVCVVVVVVIVIFISIMTHAKLSSRVVVGVDGKGQRCVGVCVDA
jgi:hypothetical protein